MPITYLNLQKTPPTTSLIVKATQNSNNVVTLIDEITIENSVLLSYINNPSLPFHDIGLW